MWQFKAQQNEGELRDFVNVLKMENITSYLEIGSKWGGSLWRVAQILPKGAKIVSVDLPTGDTETSLRRCVFTLKENGFDVTLVRGDSTNPAIIEQVRKLAPFDCCLIDANHTLSYVHSDWLNYGSLARIVAFHDVSYDRPVPKGRLPIQVPEFWKTKIKPFYRHVEIRHEPRDNGFGILWREEAITEGSR